MNTGLSVTCCAAPNGPGWRAQEAALAAFQPLAGNDDVAAAAGPSGTGGAAGGAAARICGWGGGPAGGAPRAQPPLPAATGAAAHLILDAVMSAAPEAEGRDGVGEDAAVPRTPPGEAGRGAAQASPWTARNSAKHEHETLA
jgi:hypothetical protein